MPTPTLILDGIWGRPRRFAKMRRLIEQSGAATEIFYYDASGLACIEVEGRKLADEIRRRGQPVNVVAFSMGGLVVRAAALAVDAGYAHDPLSAVPQGRVLACEPNAGSEQKPPTECPNPSLRDGAQRDDRCAEAALFRRAVFINSPHAGSILAYLLPFKRLRAVQQLRPGSDLLRRLNNTSWNVPTLAVWCPLDQMIIPGKSARWDKADTCIRCNVPLHSWAIHSPSIQRQVAAFLQRNQ